MIRREERMPNHNNWTLRVWECCELEWQLICVVGWKAQADRWNWNPKCPTCGAICQAGND